ncbi:MAG: PKD repeat protein [Marinoscillum sp.]|jgi:PKD repeat protein
MNMDFIYDSFKKIILITLKIKSMKKMKMYSKGFLLFTTMLALLVFVSCDEIADAVGDVEDPIASFQFEVDEADFLKVTFTNFSQNATSYSWDFGDGESSTDENPAHTFAASGSYDIVLTAINDKGQATSTKKVALEDPLSAQRNLVGDNGKVWQFIGDASTGMNPYEVGPDDFSQVWWSLGGVEPLCVRECVMDDTWTFNTNGTFTFENNGDSWGEGGAFAEGVSGTCFDATVASNWVGPNGEDLNGWNSGTHDFTFDPVAGKLTIVGGFIGIPKAADNAEVTVPSTTVTYDVIKLVDGDVDTLVVQTPIPGGYWRSVLVSYDNAGDKIVIGECAAVTEADVTFKLNMSDYTGSFTTMNVSGSFNGWSGDANPMTDMGDGLWELTIPIAVGDHEYKFQYDNWTDGGEGFGDGTGYEACVGTSDNANWNRLVTVGESAMTVGTFCYNSCDDCSGNTPGEAAPAPTAAAGDVISIYSDTYGDIAGLNIDPDWGQATVTTGAMIGDNNMVKMEGLNYQGISWEGTPQDLAGKTHVHLDVWTKNATAVKFFLIGGGETFVDLTITTGEWVGYDIALSEYSSAVNLANVIQFKFDAVAAGDSPTLFVDNMYFY